MSQDHITFEQLNAYVDGELDAVETAEVARAVADNPVLAGQVAALTQLRSALKEVIDIPALKLPARNKPGAWRGIVAAGVAFVMFVVGSVAMTALDRDFRDGWLNRAWEIHHSWSLEQALADTRTVLLPVRYTDAVSGAYVPDLSAAKLSVTHTGLHEFSGNRTALLVGYRGTRGCKISLITFTRPLNLEEELRYYQNGKNEAYAWRAGKLGYVILSDGMDAPRFKLLAKSVLKTSRLHLPFDKKTHLALGKSREESQPCIA